MTTFNSAEIIHMRLEDLADALELEDEAEPIDMLVCGGAALAVMGLVARATDDIDVLALVLDERDVAAKPFPDPLLRAVQRVARTRGLPKKWLNPGPADMQRFGLPDGIIERANNRTYGELLTARYLDRYDQIHLKLYAAIDQSGGKHAADLANLEASTAELIDAARWCMQHDPSAGFKTLLDGFLKRKGYDDVVEQLSD